MAWALKQYSPEDCDVALFDKLLRHQVDERYRDAHYQFKERVESALNSLHINRKTSNLTLSEAEKVSESLFPVCDRQLLVNDYKKFMGWFRGKEGQAQLPAAVFTHIVMRYRLSQYEESIKALRSAFEACDSDDDGCLSQAEFLRFLSHMTPAPDPDTSRSWLFSLDPSNMQVFPFSPCIALLSPHTP